MMPCVAISALCLGSVRSVAMLSFTWAHLREAGMPSSRTVILSL